MQIKLAQNIYNFKISISSVNKNKLLLNNLNPLGGIAGTNSPV